MLIFRHISLLSQVKIFKNRHFFDMNASARLKLVRKKLKLTQEYLGKSIGLNRGKITSLESGVVKISTLHALALEHVHGINRDWLLEGEGAIFTDDKSQNSFKDHQPKYDLLFQENEIAQGVIQNLKKIESKDKRAFKEIAGYIAGFEKGLKFQDDSPSAGVAPEIESAKKIS